MSDLIEALQIFLKYGNPRYPTSRLHDELVILGINPEVVSDDDKSRLEELGFFVNHRECCFSSSRFGEG